MNFFDVLKKQIMDKIGQSEYYYENPEFYSELFTFRVFNNLTKTSIKTLTKNESSIKRSIFIF